MFALAFQPKGIDYKQNTIHSNRAQSMLYYWAQLYMVVSGFVIHGRLKMVFSHTVRKVGDVIQRKEEMPDI